MISLSGDNTSQEKEEDVTRHKIFLLIFALILALLLTLSCGTFQELFATPTITPTITPTSQPDLSGAVLTLDDLPPGFIAIPLDELGVSIDDLGGDGFEFESVFVFMDAANFEFVMGFTTLLLTGLNQAGFDVALSHPEFIIEALAPGMGATGISEQEELANLDDIGDASAGLTMKVNMEGIPMRVDMAVFRRDVAGAAVLIFYIEGDVPVVAVGDAARKLDARIVEILQPGN
jgi:hypothetical protein